MLDRLRNQPEKTRLQEYLEYLKNINSYTNEEQTRIEDEFEEYVDQPPVF